MVTVPARRDPSELPTGQLQRIAAVARRFFLDDRSKSEIATEFGLSRFKVARLLDEARDLGIVRIEIRVPRGLDTPLAAELRRTFGLRHTVVVEVPDLSLSVMRQELARAAARLLGEIVTPEDVLGVGYGRTLTLMAECVDHLADCPVVQLTGALIGVNPAENSVELVRRIADRSGGTCYQMYAPQVLPDVRTAALLRRQPEVAETHRQFDRVTKAVVAVGSWDPPQSQLYDFLPRADRADLLRQKAIAEVCAILLDGDGQQVAADFTQRCISIDGEQLRRVDDVIAVAGGADKVSALRAVLRGGYASGLVVNTPLAAALLAEGVGD